MEHSKSVNLDSIKNYSDYYKNNQISKIATKALSKSSIDNICYDLDNAKKMNHKFSVDIQTMAATDQKSSNRCWIFSSLNILREKIAKDLNISNFELSQNFISFYDHLEKANYFLENIIETANRPLNDRLVNSLLSYPMSDGGWWDMFVGLYKKYGVVPKEAMPETYQSNHTFAMNDIISSQLRKDAAILRKQISEKKDISEVRKLKDNMLKDVYNIIAVCFGNPPETFDFEYVDKDKNYHIDKNLTPHEFYEKYIGADLDNIVSLINAPMENRPFNKTYAISYTGSVIEGRPVKFLNLTIEELKEAAIKQLKNNEPIWFTCDCGKYANRDEGIWDTAMYDYESPFSVEFEMNKGDMMAYRESSPNHAMTLTGVNLVDGKPDKWKVENSWGTEKANSGYHIMSDDWFDKYVYIVCIDRKYLSDEQNKLYDQEPIMIDPWDPMA